MTMFSLMLGEWEVGNYLGSHDFDEVEFNTTYFKSHNASDFNVTDYQQARLKEETPNACYWRDHKMDADFEEGRYHPNLEVFSIIIFLCIYMIIMSILFYHLLIAMVIDAHSRVRASLFIKTDRVCLAANGGEEALGTFEQS